MDFHEHNTRNLDIGPTVQKLNTITVGLQGLVAGIRTFELTLAWLQEHQWQGMKKEPATDIFDHQNQWISELQDMRITLTMFGSKLESMVREIETIRSLVCLIVAMISDES